MKFLLPLLLLIAPPPMPVTTSVNPHALIHRIPPANIAPLSPIKYLVLTCTPSVSPNVVEYKLYESPQLVPWTPTLYKAAASPSFVVPYSDFTNAFFHITAVNQSGLESP